MSTTTYRFLLPRKNALVYANTANVKDTLAVTHSTIVPRGMKNVVIQRNAFTLNESYAIPQPVGCEDACNKQAVDLSVGLVFSGPISAKTSLKAMALKLQAMLEAGEFDEIFDGFPANQTDIFTLTQA